MNNTKGKLMRKKHEVLIRRQSSYNLLDYTFIKVVFTGWELVFSTLSSHNLYPLQTGHTMHTLSSSNSQRIRIMCPVCKEHLLPKYLPCSTQICMYAISHICHFWY